MTMIDVKCSQCQEGFSVPESLAGQQENCPTCGHIVVIPAGSGTAPTEKTSPPKMSVWKRDIFGRKMPPKGVGRVGGIISTISGMIVTALALQMDITVGGTNIANLDKMNQRSDLIVIGVGLFVCGIVVLCMNAIHQTIIRSRGQT